VCRQTNTTIDLLQHLGGNVLLRSQFVANQTKFARLLGDGRQRRQYPDAQNDCQQLAL